MSAEIYQIKCTDIKDQDKSLSEYEGKVLLIVNTASNCGFTPQYKELESLYQRYRDEGFEILAFPCNQFLKQEPGDSQQISQFCELNYGVTFPVFKKIDVNGTNAHPLYQYLKSAAPGVLNSKAIKWNFTKFLLTRDGEVKGRFAPRVKPSALESEIEELLA